MLKRIKRKKLFSICCGNSICHSRPASKCGINSSGNPAFSFWAPAFAGVTSSVFVFCNRNYLTDFSAALGMMGVCAALGMTVEVSCSEKLQSRKELPSNNRCASIRRKSLKLLAVIASKS